jgi:hypothetical protein
MRNVLAKTLAASGLLLFGVSANAQLAPRNQYRYQDQDRQQVDLRQTCNRIRADLDRAESRTSPFSAERTRISVAREELNQFDRGLDDGYVDSRAFDRMVTAIHRVADMNSMPEWNRDALTHDLIRLQDALENQ